MLTSTGRLSRRLQCDIENGKSPLDWPVVLNDDQRAAEVDKCANVIDEIQAATTATFTANDLVAEEIYQMASRITHYQ